MADQRDVTEQGNLEDVGLLLANHNAADNHGPTVANQHLCFGRLRRQSRDAIDQWDPAINLRILYHHLHENISIRGDLRGHLEPQYRVDVLNRDRVVDRGLNGNLRALLDLRQSVVLGNQLRTGEKLAYAFALCGRDDEVQRVVGRYP